jgi:adenylate cyclase class 2
MSESDETLEIEMKIQLDTFINQKDSLEKLTKEFGKNQEALIQIDSYYMHPVLNYAETDEALRIRTITNLRTGSEEIELTYKGPKQGSDLKIREELTVNISDISILELILKRLKFTKVDFIRKQRWIWITDSFLLSLDKVDDVGLFIEVETHGITPKLDVKTLKEKITQILSQIFPKWLKKEERRSYLELKLLNDEKNE